MGDRSTIEWTDATWNPVRGCSRVSAGCVNCYAERVAHRFSGPGQPYEGLTNEHGRWNGTVRLVEEHLTDPLRWRKPRRIFVNSMSDLFHESLPYDVILRLFVVMSAAAVRHHTFQVLTKRAERAAELAARLPWSPNIWMGVSVENQEAADERIPHLLRIPARVRFLSCEPLLSPLDLSPWLPDIRSPFTQARTVPEQESHPRIRWVIAGGESGHGARPMHPAWARALRDQCVAAGVPFFFKQWGEFAPYRAQASMTSSLGSMAYASEYESRPSVTVADGTVVERVGKARAGRVLDGRTWDEFPADVTHV